MAFYSFLFFPNRNTDRARRNRFGVHGQLLHVAIYSFLFLLKERQTGLGLGGMGGQLLHGPFYSFLILIEERQTWLGERGMGGQLLHGAFWPFLPLLKERQTSLGKREGWVANSCMAPSSPFYSF